MNNQIRFASGLMTGSTEKKAETEKRLTSAKGTRLYRVFRSASASGSLSFAYLAFGSLAGATSTDGKSHPCIVEYLSSLLAMGRLIILSGPSCVGKGPLHTAFRNFYPEHAAKLRKLVLYNCRSPRPGEIDGKDYHFRSREEILRFREKENFIVLDVRGDLQAVDLNGAERALAAGDLFFEGNPFAGRQLQKAFASKVTVLSIFLTPLSREEIEFLQSQERSLSLADFLTDVMRRKLLRRTQRQKNILSLKDLENIERRAASAYTELKEAWKFEYVIPNHDGEDSENWDAFYYPVGDARKTLFAFADLVGGKVSPLVEKWDEPFIL